LNVLGQAMLAELLHPLRGSCVCALRIGQGTGLFCNACAGLTPRSDSRLDRQPDRRRQR
jgi:hypothetical protein